MSEIKFCLSTQCSDLTFREFLLKKYSELKFIMGRFVDDNLSIELFVDNILDNLQWREVELLHWMVDHFLDEYFDLFISDVIETIVHECIHYFERARSEPTAS
jgi:hypothetical protein